jgi:hypothetical protein
MDYDRGLIKDTRDSVYVVVEGRDTYAHRVCSGREGDTDAHCLWHHTVQHSTTQQSTTHLSLSLSVTASLIHLSPPSLDAAHVSRQSSWRSHTNACLHLCEHTPALCYIAATCCTTTL